VFKLYELVVLFFF